LCQTPLTRIPPLNFSSPQDAPAALAQFGDWEDDNTYFGFRKAFALFFHGRSEPSRADQVVFVVLSDA
jgi:hypothetical protein